MVRASTNKRRIRFGLAVALVLGIISLVAIFYLRSQTGSPILGFAASGSRASGGRSLPVLWDVPGFSAVDQDGRVVTDQSLRGRVWIAAFIFTRCTTVCPVITTRMAQLRRSLLGADVRFVSFSVDPDFDTPAVLKQYSLGWSGDARWLLLNAGANGVRNLARGMHAALESGTEPNTRILHSSHLFLVDRQLKVRGTYDSADESALQRLVADASALDARTASPAPTAGTTSTDGAGAAVQKPTDAPQDRAADPVCGMLVAASAEHPHVEHGGKRYYFCSDVCRDEFLKNPDRYVRPE